MSHIKPETIKKMNKSLSKFKKLNSLLLEKELSAVDRSQKAVIGARIVSVGKSKYRLKIYNKGEAPAYNLTVELPERNDLLLKSEIERKFPLFISRPCCASSPIDQVERAKSEIDFLIPVLLPALFFT